MCEVTPHANSPSTRIRSPDPSRDFTGDRDFSPLHEVLLGIDCSRGTLEDYLSSFSQATLPWEIIDCRFLWKDALGVGCRIRHVLSTEHSRTFVLLNHVRVFHYRYFVGLTPVSRANFQRLIHHLPKL
jgi:hypothetical protein